MTTRTAAINLFIANVRSLTDEALAAYIKGADARVAKIAARESLRRERAAERFISYCMH